MSFCLMKSKPLWSFKSLQLYKNDAFPNEYRRVGRNLIFAMKNFLHCLLTFSEQPNTNFLTCHRKRRNRRGKKQKPMLDSKIRTLGFANPGSGPSHNPGLPGLSFGPSLKAGSRPRLTPLTYDVLCKSFFDFHKRILIMLMLKLSCPNCGKYSEFNIILI